MYLERIYRHRFRGIDQERRVVVWRHISRWVVRQLDFPQKILEVGAGRCEFINQCGAEEKWALDFAPGTRQYAALDVEVITGRLQEIDFGNEYFDAIFMSNFLEHLSTPEEVNQILTICFSRLKKGGSIGILGPNFKYAFRDYFDCADHVLPLTHIGVSEHLAEIGFNDIKLIPRFLPYSFRSALPSYPVLVKWYLSFPPVWRIVGKQFFITARKG